MKTRLSRLTTCWLTIISLALMSCSGGAPQKKQTTSSNTELVVTYQGKEVHRRNVKWISEERLGVIAAMDEKKYLIFGAEWCKACTMLRKALVQAELIDRVHFINIDEPWAQKLASFFGIQKLPTLLCVNEKDVVFDARLGPGQIIVYLLTKI